MILDLLFPKMCLNCNHLGTYLCLTCRQSLEFVQKDSCFYCQKVSALGLTHEGCQRKNELDGFMSACYYNDTMKKVLKNIKYKYVKDACREVFLSLNPLLLSRIQRVKRLYPGIVIQPIPLHKNKLNRRGFNQSEVFAQFFSQMIDIPLVDYLQRVKDTSAQAQTTNKMERYENMRNAFKIRQNMTVLAKTVLLLDDVVTTGSTVKEAVKTLKKGGIKNVLVLCLATGKF